MEPLLKVAMAVLEQQQVLIFLTQRLLVAVVVEQKVEDVQLVEQVVVDQEQDAALIMELQEQLILVAVVVQQDQIIQLFQLVVVDQV
tara:strand:- start:72 stop:332 length:261 start_codon:yes stop_codon:yes gene_type:complete